MQLRKKEFSMRKKCQAISMIAITMIAFIGVFAVTLFLTGCPQPDTGSTDGDDRVAMVWVPGGSFQMGTASGGDNDERPVHTVTLGGFYMAKYPVTQDEYQTVMGSNPSFFNASPASGETQGKRPVEMVSWYDAIVFCNKLSMAEGLSPVYRISGSTNPADWGAVPTGYNATWDAAVIVSGASGYRLPTEAQWEYAAKGGNGSPGNYTYSGSDNVDDVAWYYSNSDNRTHEVGKKGANGLGLYDMSGNMWEWCWDWYGDYSSGVQTDPTGAASGVVRVRRGGGWYNSAEDIHSTFRGNSNPSGRVERIGFRLLRP
jgi:formylglycine-generating enzyme required for sulfatase activity